MNFLSEVEKAQPRGLAPSAKSFHQPVQSNPAQDTQIRAQSFVGAPPTGPPGLVPPIQPPGSSMPYPAPSFMPQNQHFGLLMPCPPPGFAPPNHPPGLLVPAPKSAGLPPGWPPGMGASDNRSDTAPPVQPSGLLQSSVQPSLAQPSVPVPPAGPPGCVPSQQASQVAMDSLKCDNCQKSFPAVSMDMCPHLDEHYQNIVSTLLFHHNLFK